MKTCAFTTFITLNLIGVENIDVCKSSKIEVNNDAPFKLIGFFPIINSLPRKFKTEALPWVESMKYMIDKANQRVGKELFGYTIYDTCSPEENDPLVDSVVDMILGNDSIKEKKDQCLCSERSNNLRKIIGIIGPADSSSTILLNSFIGLDEIPVIGYAATSNELSDKNNYPHFFRSAPPDAFQAIIINDLLLHFKWNYVSLVIGDNNYGRKGADTLKKQFGDRVCVDAFETISNAYKRAEYLLIIDKLKRENSSNVIIVWSWYDQVRNLLLVAQEKKLLNRTWIFSEAVSMTDWFIEFKRNFQGNLLLIVKTPGENVDFMEHFLNLTYYESIKTNPWFHTFFQNNNITYLDTRIGDLNMTFDFSLAGLVENAVNVLISAFFDYQRDTDVSQMSCDTSSCDLVLNKTELNKLIKRVNFSGVQNETFTFDDNHDPVRKKFAIYLVKEDVYEKLTVWSSSENSNFKHFEIDHAIHDVVSFCSKDCPPGMTAIIDSNKPCCWQCVRCSNFSVKATSGQHKCKKCQQESNYFPNRDLSECLRLEPIYWSLKNDQQIIYVIIVLTVSIIGVLLTIIFIMTFIINRNTPIIRSSNFRISMLQLCIQLVLFFYPVLMLEDETRRKCFVKNYVSGFLFMIVITLILIKVTGLVHVFSNMRRLSRKDRLTLNSKQIVIFLAIVSTYVIVLILIEKTHPLRVRVIKNFTLHTLHSECKSSYFFFAHISCVIIVISLCAVQCFRGRSIPWKFNEAHYIAVALFSSTLVKIVSIPIGKSIDDHNKYKLLLCLVTLISNLLLLLVLFGYKIVIIFVDPKENTVESFRSASITSIMRSITFSPQKVASIKEKSISKKLDSLTVPSFKCYQENSLNGSRGLIGTYSDVSINENSVNFETNF